AGALCGVVHRNRFAETAYTPDLDVDDAAGAALDSGGGIAGVVYAFIETDVGFELLLQFSMKVEIIRPERLLDHQQLEPVDVAQMFGIRQSVGRVGIDAKHNLWPARANALHDIHVPAGLDLDLDAAIAGR